MSLREGLQLKSAHQHLPSANEHSSLVYDVGEKVAQLVVPRGSERLALSEHVHTLRVTLTV